MKPEVREVRYHLPENLAAHFSEHSGLVFFDSASNSHPQGRYSFIAVNPFEDVTVSDCDHAQEVLATLKQKLTQFRLEPHEGLPPFQGGLAGFLSYDLARSLESLPQHESDPMEFPLMSLGLYDLVFAYDHSKQKSYIFSSGFPENELNRRLDRAKKQLDWAEAELDKVVNFYDDGREIVEVSPTSSFTQKIYEAAVERVKSYIFEGDIFQANLSQCYRGALKSSEEHPFLLYSRLRKASRAPFSAYMKFDDAVIASASPERFLKLSKGEVETRPIKGTCARSNNPVEDRTLASSLLESKKDRAENTMIVDLMRNDLSKVCEPGSIAVPQICALESYSNVHHLVSCVIGVLREGVDAIDLLKATFPGGSITGAPKIRAMEIIAELEPTARGPYTGAALYVGFDGAMDSSIMIRTCCLKGNEVTYQVGGAVVLKSEASKEYDETLVKAKNISQVLGEGQ